MLKAAYKEITPVQRGLLRKPYEVLPESVPPLEEAEEDAKWPSVTGL